MQDDILDRGCPTHAQGRIVIPAHLRKAMNLKSGDRLLVRRENERIVLERREAVAARLRKRFSHIQAGVSLVDELLEERRAEAAQDAAEK